MFVRFPILTAVVLCFAAVAAAQEAPGPQRIAFIDVERIIEESSAIRDAMEAMDSELAAKARAVDGKEREFRRLRFELDRQLRLLSQEESRRRYDELGTLQEEIDRLKFDFEMDLKDRERQLQPLLERVYGIIADVAEREGIDVVLRGEVVIWGNTASDLTPLVVGELDARADEVVELFRRDVKTDDTPTTGPAERIGTGQIPVPRRNDSGDAPLPLIP